MHLQLQIHKHSWEGSCCSPLSMPLHTDRHANTPRDTNRRGKVEPKKCGGQRWLEEGNGWYLKSHFSLEAQAEAQSSHPLYTQQAAILCRQLLLVYMQSTAVLWSTGMREAWPSWWHCRGQRPTLPTSRELEVQTRYSEADTSLLSTCLFHSHMKESVCVGVILYMSVLGREAECFRIKCRISIQFWGVVMFQLRCQSFVVGFSMVVLKLCLLFFPPFLACLAYYKLPW